MSVFCQSAGVWHMAEVAPEGESILALAGRSTKLVRGAVIAGEQPREWLCRPLALMNNPATLPPFFGGFLFSQAPSQSQATMVHALTYAGELNCMVSFTSPGVSRRFAEETAKRIKSALVSMARDKEFLGIGKSKWHTALLRL